MYNNKTILNQDSFYLLESQAAMVLSVIGISNTVGRILTGLVADRPWADPLALCSTSLVLSAVCVAIFPLIQEFFINSHLQMTKSSK
jgi:predicted MFS family arabinose efflux permease